MQNRGRDESGEQKQIFLTNKQAVVEKLKVPRKIIEVHALFPFAGFDTKKRIVGERGLWPGVQYGLHVYLSGYIL